MWPCWLSWKTRTHRMHLRSCFNCLDGRERRDREINCGLKGNGKQIINRGGNNTSHGEKREAMAKSRQHVVVPEHFPTEIHTFSLFLYLSQFFTIFSHFSTRSISCCFCWGEEEHTCKSLWGNMSQATSKIWNHRKFIPSLQADWVLAALAHWGRNTQHAV